MKQKELNKVLLYAVMLGDVAVVKAVIKDGASLYTTDQFGRTLIQVAKSNNNKEIGELLKHLITQEDQKKSVLDQDLRQAIREKDLEAISLALKNGADIWATDDEGETPLDIAWQIGNPIQKFFESYIELQKQGAC